MYYLTDNVHCYIFASNSQIIYYEIMVKLKDGFTGERALVLPRMIVDRMEEDPLTSMLHITDIGYYPKAKHHFRERKEPINQYVFIYCIDGAGWYRIGEQEYTVSANILFFRLASLMLMLPTSPLHGLFTGYTSKESLHRFMRRKPVGRWISNQSYILASVHGSICLRKYSIH